MQPARYTVEVHVPDLGWADLQRAAALARQATDELRREGEQVRFLRSIFVPEDGACFFLYEGSSAEAVRAAAVRARLGVGRVDATLRLDEEEEAT
jgi:Protein of unknown function (DUF4242)